MVWVGQGLQTSRGPFEPQIRHQSAMFQSNVEGERVRGAPLRMPVLQRLLKFDLEAWAGGHGRRPTAKLKQGSRKRTQSMDLKAAVAGHRGQA